ncbi:MAG: type VII toxin-antitoxin system HepT family RNase toxin [Candidatus Asgardarchaeia archaeon]
MNIDKDRILGKLSELDTYLAELSEIIPHDFDEYKRSIAIRRACERLLQILIECVIDICNILVSNLKLGIPADEDDIFKKLVNANVISSELATVLKNMKGFRNILVHKYGTVNDELVFEFLKDNLEDFSTFKEAIIDYLKRMQS